MKDMKKIIILFFSALVLFTSCKKLTDFNEDTKNASKVTSESLLSNAEKNLSDQVVTSSINLNPTKLLMQYWTQVTYIDESNYNYTTRKIPDNEFRIIYRDVLSDLNESKKIIATELDAISSKEVKANKTAIVEILTVYSYQRLVDIFGNIPYEQALDINNVLPQYDDAKTIYKKLFERLDVAINSIDVAHDGFGKDADIFYNSDMVKWKKFANSLKLKMAITVADVSDLSPATKAAEALAAGVFQEQSDGAFFKYLATAPNNNPIYNDIIASGRFDFVITTTFVNAMTTLNDPRIEKYMTKAPDTTAYIGLEPGKAGTYKLFSHIQPNTVLSPTALGVLLDYTEVQFYLAEAAERGFIAGSAKTYYDEGIKSSFKYWEVPDSSFKKYIVNPAVDFATASGSNFEKIANQAWIAYYNRGNIAWDMWRRLDAPKLNPVPGKSLADVPVRFTYPISEQTLNGKNYSAAASAIGGDNSSTKLFWDKN
jgi:hypothetical protein